MPRAANARIASASTFCVPILALVEDQVILGVNRNIDLVAESGCPKDVVL